MEEILCKLGDIIVIDEFRNEIGKTVKRHSFVVINDEGNYIEGLRYDFVCNMLCSFHNEVHKKKKLSYKANMMILGKDVIVDNGNDKQGYIKADQLYYFNKMNIKYYVVGEIKTETLNRLFMLMIIIMEKKMSIRVTSNLNDS